MVRIVANPGILGGKPIVEGTHLSVAHILGLLASGMSNQEIIADYPELILPQNLRRLAEPLKKFPNPTRARDPNFGNVGQNYCYGFPHPISIVWIILVKYNIFRFRNGFTIKQHALNVALNSFGCLILRLLKCIPSRYATG